MHHLRQVYGTDLSAESVSRITDAVLEEVRAWQDRPLDPVWAVVFLDAIVVKVRDNHVVQNKPAYIALGVDGDGEKHVLGIWLAKTPLESAAAGESARFWASGSPPGSAAFTPRPARKPRSKPWPLSRPARSARSTPRPSRSGKTPGTPSRRSWRSARPSASCCTPPTASRA